MRWIARNCVINTPEKESEECCYTKLHRMKERNEEKANKRERERIIR